MNGKSWRRRRVERLALWFVAIFALLLIVSVASLLALIYDALAPLADHMHFVR